MSKDRNIWMVPAQRLIESARRFCTLVDRVHLAEADIPQLHHFHHLLLPLYSAALALPPIPFEECKCEERLSNADMESIYRALGRLTGPRDKYREVFDPYDALEEAEVFGSLMDDFGDIYRDLREGLGCWELGHHASAGWTLRESFRFHWGKHLVDSLRPLHQLAVEHGYDWNDSPLQAG